MPIFVVQSGMWTIDQVPQNARRRQTPDCPDRWLEATAVVGDEATMIHRNVW